MVAIDNSWRDIYQFDSQFFSLADGKKLHYIDEGDKKAPTILCLHGNPSWSFFYRSIAKNLNANYRVIALDHLGCGLSDSLDSPSYSLREHIANLKAFISGLNLVDVNLVMHDWGGAIGMGWAIGDQKTVNSLTFMNTAAFHSRDIPKRIGILRTPIIGQLAIRRLNLFSRAALYMASTTKLAPKVQQGYLAPYTNPRRRNAVAAFVNDIPVAPSHPSYSTIKHIEKNLPLLKTPVLCLWGKQDFCFHLGFFRHFKKVYPHAESIVLENAGHYLIEDAPHDVSSYLNRFLEQSV